MHWIETHIISAQSKGRLTHNGWGHTEPFPGRTEDNRRLFGHNNKISDRWKTHKQWVGTQNLCLNRKKTIVHAVGGDTMIIFISTTPRILCLDTRHP